MKRLQVDFSAARRASPWVGRVMLALAAVISLDAALAYQSLHKATREGEKQLARRAPGPAMTKATPQEVAAVRETVQRLSLPWDELFAALEAAASDTITLAAIEPDTGKGTVTISADGKDYLAALSYVSNLSRSERLDRVQLVRHEQKANSAGSSVSFAVSAAWSTR